MSELPTFEDMRFRALQLLRDAENELRSDWRTGTGQTPEQGKAAREARRALDRAASN